jgi:hypothetical protein
LHNGILKAQERAESTLKKAKEAMFLNYWLAQKTTNSLIFKWQTIKKSRSFLPRK